jgi:hypothetical protein
VLGNLKAHTQAMQSSGCARLWTVCRFHGAGGGAPKGKANGSYKYGLYTQEAQAERRLLSKLIQESRKVLSAF